MPILGLASSIILQLSQLPYKVATRLPSLVMNSVDRLERWEESTEIFIDVRRREVYRQDRSVSLHPSQGLHEPPVLDDVLQSWGDSVEMLWRVVMNFEEKSAAWDALTCRLLLWRTIVGEEGSAVGEWSRRELVQNLCA
jgi:nucleolar pre-ribosomal-associated protein 1